jgi:hypothetical protein
MGWVAVGLVSSLEQAEHRLVVERTLELAGRKLEEPELAQLFALAPFKYFSFERLICFAWQRCWLLLV